MGLTSFKRVLFIRFQKVTGKIKYNNDINIYFKQVVTEIILKLSKALVLTLSPHFCVELMWIPQPTGWSQTNLSLELIKKNLFIIHIK